MAELVKVTDHATQALAKLASSFRDKVKFQKLAAIYLAEVQALEDALFQVLLDKRLSSPNCLGVILDEIGKKVGQARNGVDDATYKKLIAARQRANHSNGHVNDVYAVFDALALTYTLTPRGNKGFELRVLGAITAELASIYADFLRRIREAGTNGQLRYQLQADATMLTCPAQVGYLTVAANIGDGTLTLGSTANLPSSSISGAGGVIVSNVIDSIAWTGKTGTTLTGVTGVSAAHGIGAAVQINDTAKGLGTSGGFLAGVLL